MERRVWFHGLAIVDQWEFNNWCRFWLNSDVTRSHWLSRILRLVGTRSSCFMRLGGTCENATRVCCGVALLCLESAYDRSAYENRNHWKFPVYDVRRMSRLWDESVRSVWSTVLTANIPPFVSVLISVRTMSCFRSDLSSFRLAIWVGLTWDNWVLKPYICDLKFYHFEVPISAVSSMFTGLEGQL